MWRGLLLVAPLLTVTQAFHPAPIRWGGRRGKILFLASPGTLDRVATPQQLSVKETSGRTLHNEIPYFTINHDNTISCVENEKRWCLEAIGTRRGHGVCINLCTGRQTQKWKWLPLGQIQLQGTKQCIHVNENGGLTKDVVELGECANKETETWTLEHATPSPTRISLQSPASSIFSAGVVVMLAALSLGAWLSLWRNESRMVVASEGNVPFNRDEAGVWLTEPLALRLSNVPFATGQNRHGDDDVRCRPRRFDANEIVMKLQSARSNDQVGTPPLRVFKLSEHAVIPTRGSAGAAGYDLSAAHPVTVPPQGKAIVPTDLAMAIPEGCYGRIAPRSSMAWKKHTDIGAGVIDMDYRGPVGVVVFNLGEVPVEILRGDRIAQLVLERIATPEVLEVAEERLLETTTRGAGGFGSTGA